MDTITQQVAAIEKEKIAALKFPEEEVLNSADEKKQRLADLNKALSLGNLEHGKIQIIFEDTTGIKKVDTTVWGLTDKRVILKQSIMIPIHRVHKVII